MSGQRISLFPVQWHRIQKIEDMKPIGDDDYEVLKELSEVLLRHGFENRFGICLIHKHFELAPGEMALEETDEQSRRSVIRVVSEDQCKDAMETAWQFSAESEIKAGRNCTLKCKGSGLTSHPRYHECKLT
jgi:hypothetical protein